jgi:signal transduction histidine kinase
MDFLNGGGEMAALMRSYDWSRSPLGDPATWPTTLKSAIATCLRSQFPMVIWWGPELLMLYNDAWRPILGETKHPHGLGRPGKDSWRETWPVVGAQFQRALEGAASWSEDLLLASDRHGYLEEAYFTYSHGPLMDASGTIVGVLSVVSETTNRVLNERRLQTLTRLSASTIEATRKAASPEDMCQLLGDTLCRDNPDAAFAVQYLTDSPQCVRRVAVTGFDAQCLPEKVVSTDRDDWGIANALRSRSHVVIERAASERLPGGAWPEPTTELIVLPLFHSARDADLFGILVVGANARLRLDSSYLAFLQTVAELFGSALSALEFIYREREARADAERAARMRDEFLATLSHELRSPLHAVLGWTQILQNSAAEPELVANAVEVIERNARLQARVITDLLDISRAVSGNLHLNLQDVDIEKAIASAIASVAPSAAAKGIEITTKLDRTSQSVRGDPERIEQMLWNLLSNALKFAGVGGRVQVTTEAMDRHLSIYVRDNGEGIDAAFLPHLFERFRQFDASSSRRHQGLGLGLAIVKQFAELQGGSVSATSDGLGQGATFVLRLPCSDVRNSSDSLASETTPLKPDHADLDGVSVLIVDDQQDALVLLKRILEDADASVESADCAEDALEMLSHKRFDVIVSDIAMPGMNGYEFVVEMLKRGIDTPAIALSAFALPSDVIKSTAVGFRAHVSKPIETASLLATISRCVDRHIH